MALEMGSGRRCPLTNVLAAALVLMVTIPGRVLGDGDTFDKYFNILYGHHQVKNTNGGLTMEFDMDKSTGSGFRSKIDYNSRSFEMNIKLPNIKDSKGVITTYYMTSLEKNHTEIDLEFINGKLLQTNFYIDDVGGREQRLDLWFDPSADYHSYQIIWNPTFIGIFVDKIPIRFFKKKPGQIFLAKPQYLMGTLWSAPDWAGNVDWSKQPFKAYYSSPFKIEGCPKGSNSDCDNNSWWGKVQDLTPKQKEDYEKYKKYVNYDYCKDKTRKAPENNDC
ncbi:hypothetical protein V2J09_022018 [Rumex salicifolius]